MRILMTPWPTPAHLYPVVPLAWALQAAGHDVRVAAHPALAETTAACGLPAVSLGEADSVSMPLGPGRPQPKSVTEKLLRIKEALRLAPEDVDTFDVFYQFMLPAMWEFHPIEATPADEHEVLDALVDFAKDWQPDLVLWDPCFPGGAVAARACGAAHGRVLWGQDYFGWVLDRIAERADGPGPVPEENPMIEAVRASAARYDIEVDTELLLGQWTIDPTPVGVRLPTKDVRTISMRWVPFAMQNTAPTRLPAPSGKPRIALSLGLSQRTHFEGGWDHVPPLMEMLSTMDVEVVATLNDAQLANVPALPDNVHVVDYVPLSQLLSTCTAAIHHGGMGTFAACCAANVPQLVAYSDVDNHMITIEKDGLEWSMVAKHTEAEITANHITERGAGGSLYVDPSNVDGMRKVLEELLTEPSFRAAAQSLYDDQVAMPSPLEVVGVVERLVAEQLGRKQGRA
jgi:glycosyltransferase